MAYLQGVKDYTAALENPDRHPEVVPMLAKHTPIDTPEKLKARYPWWT